MKFTCSIDMDNAAFDEPNVELARILREIASDCDEHALHRHRHYAIYDINGNAVGSWTISGKRKL